ncbi:class F sortase [Streptomyces polyrhachis]|uniref:Class F sortase n=1 Tax=Streptomyces polyrhachis TaxID=1282885 RepID=A0ABW2GKV5_9ACTN
MRASEDAYRRRSVWGVLVVALLIGVYLVQHGLGTGGPPQPAHAYAAVFDPVHEAAARQLPAAPDPLPSSRPVAIRIPAIEVAARLTPVSTDKEGWVEAPPPERRNLAGWLDTSPTPGEQGTSVIDGHVDNATGPAVFYSLGTLQPGQHIDIARKDGSTAVFTVYGIEAVRKDTFPAARVYGEKGKPELRLITCGGDYTKEGGYEGNVVVFARLTEVRR